MADNLETLRGLFEGGNFSNAQINIIPGNDVHVSYEASKKSDKDDDHEGRLPSIDVMLRICKATMDLGYWKCDRSWGVVFQIWQIWGYKGTVSDFVNDINSREESKRFSYACTLTAVYKMVSKGRISRKLENWRKDGVLETYCILGELINSELEKEYPLDDFIIEEEE